MAKLIVEPSNSPKPNRNWKVVKKMADGSKRPISWHRTKENAVSAARSERRGGDELVAFNVSQGRYRQVI